MKKLVICLLACFLNVMVVRAAKESAMPAAEMKERWYDTRYYPLYDGCEEWKDKNHNYRYTVEELQNILNPPTDLLLSMSTEELARLMQDYPELNRMMMYYGEDGMQDYVTFFYFLESECDIFYELLRRPDGITCLLQEYRTSGCNEENIVDGEYDPEQYQEFYAEVFGCQLIRYYAHHFTDSEYKLVNQIIEEKVEVYNLLDDMTVYYYLDLPELEPPVGKEKSGVRTNYLNPEEIQVKEEKLEATRLKLEAERKAEEEGSRQETSAPEGDVMAVPKEENSTGKWLALAGIGAVCIVGVIIFVAGRKKRKHSGIGLTCILLCVSMCLAGCGSREHTDAPGEQSEVQETLSNESGGLSDTPKEEEEIVLANLGDCYNDVYVKVRSAYFSRKNPDVKVIYKTGEETTDKNLILEQVLSGEGPDLIWVSASDMHMLSEKGALMDLQTLVPEETLNQIYPSILENGMGNGILTGVCFDAYVHCLFANNEVWDQGSISTLDTLDAIKNSKKLYGLIGDHISISKRDFLYNLGYAPFFDVEAKESRFDDPAFAELLTVAKELGDSRMGYLKDLDVALNKLREEKLLAVTVDIMDFSEYVRLMEEYGDVCHLMSYPDATEGATGVWSGSDFLVVNANSNHKEAIGELLTYLLSEEAQQKAHYGSIRRDVRRAKAMETEGGNIYAEEYLAYLDNCTNTRGGCDGNIMKIILAGADEFFEDRCTAEEAAQAIDKEVQKYLDE